MSEGKQRSGIFKFLYIVLSIVTFPIFMILFILRHPFWILFLLCLAAGGVAYYPLSQGVKPEEVISWYQKKYQDIKFEVVTNAVESGKTDFIPQAIVDEVVKTKQKMEEDKEEAARPKSENYNENISRDKKVEEVKQDLKKRKSGFKKKNALNEANSEKNNSEVKSNSSDVSVKQKAENITLDVETLSVGGLAGLLDASADEQKKTQPVSTSAVQEKNVNVSAPDVAEENDLDVLEQGQVLPQKGSVQPKQEQEQISATSRDKNTDIPTLSSTENAIPVLLPDADDAVSDKNMHDVKEDSDTQSVPTLLPMDENVVELETVANANDGDVENQNDVQVESASQLEENTVSQSNSVSSLTGNVPEDKNVDSASSNSASEADDIFSDEDFEELKLF